MLRSARCARCHEPGSARYRGVSRESSMHAPVYGVSTHPLACRNPMGSGTASGVAKSDRGDLLNPNRRRDFVLRLVLGQPSVHR